MSFSCDCNCHNFPDRDPHSRLSVDSLEKNQTLSFLSNNNKWETFEVFGPLYKHKKKDAIKEFIKNQTADSAIKCIAIFSSSDLENAPTYTTTLHSKCTLNTTGQPSYANRNITIHIYLDNTITTHEVALIVSKKDRDIQETIKSAWDNNKRIIINDNSFYDFIALDFKFVTNITGLKDTALHTESKKRTCTIL